MGASFSRRTRGKPVRGATRRQLATDCVPVDPLEREDFVVADDVGDGQRFMQVRAPAAQEAVLVAGHGPIVHLAVDGSDFSPHLPNRRVLIHHNLCRWWAPAIVAQRCVNSSHTHVVGCRPANGLCRTRVTRGATCGRSHALARARHTGSGGTTSAMLGGGVLVTAAAWPRARTRCGCVWRQRCRARAGLPRTGGPPRHRYDLGRTRSAPSEAWRRAAAFGGAACLAACRATLLHSAEEASATRGQARPMPSCSWPCQPRRRSSLRLLRPPPPPHPPAPPRPPRAPPLSLSRARGRGWSRCTLRPPAVKSGAGLRSRPAAPETGAATRHGMQRCRRFEGPGVVALAERVIRAAVERWPSARCPWASGQPCRSRPRSRTLSRPPHTASSLSSGGTAPAGHLNVSAQRGGFARCSNHRCMCDGA